MPRRLWAFPLIILLAASIPPVLAEDDWEDDNNRAQAAFSDGNYKDAEALFLQAKKDSEKAGVKYGHYATTLLNLGQLYDKMDKVPDSEKAYKEALAIYEKSYGDSSIEDSKALNGLAECYRHHNKYQEALPLFQRALKIRNQLAPKAPDTAETLNGLGDVFRHQGKNSDALPLFQRAVDIRKEVFGPTNSKTARSLDNLSATYAALGKYDQAWPAYRDLLSARQATLGVGDPKVAQVLEDLGFAYSKVDKAKKAEAVFKQALDIREKNAKKDPKALAACKKRYADFLRGQGRKDEADKLEGKTGAAAGTGSGTTPAGEKPGAAPAAAAKPGAAPAAKAKPATAPATKPPTGKTK